MKKEEEEKENLVNTVQDDCAKCTVDAIKKVDNKMYYEVGDYDERPSLDYEVLLMMKFIPLQHRKRRETCCASGNKARRWAVKLMGTYGAPRMIVYFYVADTGF